LKRFDHRVETPGLHLLLEVLVKTLEAFGMLVNRPDVFLKADVLRGCGADHFHFGDIHPGEITGTGSPGQLHGVPAVGCDPVARFVGNQGGSDHPTIVPLLGEIAIEPLATGAGFRDKDQRGGFGWHLTDHLGDVTWSGADAAEVEDLGAVLLRHVGDTHRLLVDIHADDECARLGHG
jgi:hypothetical protein